jgi:predicted lipoprotein with Yx(FWY)xxD motif
MKIPALAALAAASALTLTACGNNNSNGTAADTTGSGGAGSSSVTGLAVASTSLGRTLVDGQGMTLYVLSADGMNKSTCSASCLQFWPASAPGGTSAIKAKTGQTTTPDGTPIATVAGHPVYTFSKDQQPGDVNGEGLQEFGGTWYAVSPSGKPLTGGTGGSSPSSPTSSSPYSRGY